MVRKYFNSLVGAMILPIIVMLIFPGLAYLHYWFLLIIITIIVIICSQMLIDKYQRIKKEEKEFRQINNRSNIKEDKYARTSQ